jgi:hypothetical protein
MAIRGNMTDIVKTEIMTNPWALAPLNPKIYGFAAIKKNKTYPMMNKGCMIIDIMWATNLAMLKIF